MVGRLSVCLIIPMLLLLGGGTLSAQQWEVRQSGRSYTLFYKIDGRDLDMTYGANRSVAGAMKADLDWLLSAGNVIAVLTEEGTDNILKIWIVE